MTVQTIARRALQRVQLKQDTRQTLTREYAVRHLSYYFGLIVNDARDNIGIYEAAIERMITDQDSALHADMRAVWEEFKTDILNAPDHDFSADDLTIPSQEWWTAAMPEYERLVLETINSLYDQRAHGLGYLNYQEYFTAAGLMGVDVYAL